MAVAGAFCVSVMKNQCVNTGMPGKCATCVEVCPEDAIRFPVARRSNPGGEYSSIDLSRRGFLYAVGGGLAADAAPWARVG